MNIYKELEENMSEFSENVLKLILQKLESQEELLVLLIPDFKTKKRCCKLFWSV